MEMPGYHNLLYLQRLDAKVQEVSEIVTGGRYFKESQTSAKEIHSKIHYREKPSILTGISYRLTEEKKFGSVNAPMLTDIRVPTTCSVIHYNNEKHVVYFLLILNFTRINITNRN